MGGDRVCHLNGGFVVELRIVGEHTSEHGDVGGRIRPAQQIVGIHVLDVLSSQCAVGKGQGVRSLFGGYEGQLLDKGGFLGVFSADFPKHTGDFSRCFQGLSSTIPPWRKCS